MTRFITYLLIALFYTPISALSADVVLTGKTLIDGDVVTVGDLFNNAGSHADHVLAPAPRVGDKLVLSKHDLERVAKAFRLNWQAPEYMASVALERNASLVETKDIIQALESSDLKTHIQDDAKFTLKNIQDAVIVSGKAPVDLFITNARMDQDSEEFFATLQIKRQDKLVKEVNLHGLATPIMSVPVLRYPMPAGSVIGANDLIETDYPKHQVRSDMIIFKTELVGMILRRGAQAGNIFTRNDVTPPVMVKRNELVTITYKNGPIQLSTKARALSAGTRGDTISFMNLSSKKPFDAKVTGPQQAEVNLDG